MKTMKKLAPHKTVSKCAEVMMLQYLVFGLDYMAQFIGGESLRFRETKQCRASSHEMCSSEWILLCCHM